MGAPVSTRLARVVLCQESFRPRYTGHAVKYTIVTFGCRVNQADSIGIERQLRALGGRAVSADEAELVVVNTCSVTATADHRACAKNRFVRAILATP